MRSDLPPPSPPLPTVDDSLSAQMGRGEIFARDCPSRQVLQHVTSRWGVLVLVALRAGTYRFSDLRRKVSGVSEKMLAQTLQQLEHNGFVLRVAHPVVPPHVEYSLTPLGHEVGAQVQDLAEWIEANLPRILARQPALPGGAADTATVATLAAMDAPARSAGRRPAR
ncbi:MAG: HTH-type transcriptional activator HxlR [Paracidovorax wautersii]|uniref:HTH-type transcriptional activator HxlR n=1 Tax=Paracidovorax wautersii TaxID=1177982 RepID=A0A7V8FNE4_9BURK|nr:MAG: HTH-type transcriptional activator HxlR [Paracidovorax wautersii]